MSHIITCRVGQEAILLDLDSADETVAGRNYELWRADTFTTKEPDTLEWIDTFVRAGDVFYDVGANIGQYSLYAAKRLGGQVVVLAFEPEALNFAKLNKNIRLNGLGEAITPYCLAISDEMALDYFYAKAFAPGAALHALGRPITQGDVPFEPQHRQGVMAVSLDDLTGRFSLPFPNHLKIDVDGLEDRIVAGAGQTLVDPRLRSVLIEVYMHQDVAARIEQAFFGRGFRLHNAAQVDYRPGIVQNLIFVKASSAP